MLVTLNGVSDEKLAGAASVGCTFPAAVRPASTRTMRVGVEEKTWCGVAKESKVESGNTVLAAEAGR